MAEALAVLEATGGKPFEEMEGETRSFRVSLPDFEMAVHETDGVVSAVWYNDPAGRLTGWGKRKKIRLYQQRFAVNGRWELRIANGWMRHYLNDIDRLHMVYGIHMDVIRINDMGPADAA